MPELPFELKFTEPEKGITFCGVEIPKYGSLTPNEAIALGQIKLDGDKPIAFYYAEVGNVILRSRTKLRTYSVDELMDLPIPISELKELFSFVVSENRQWKEPEEAPSEEGESQTGGGSIGGSDSDIPANNGLAESSLAIAQLSS